MFSFWCFVGFAMYAGACGICFYNGKQLLGLIFGFIGLMAGITGAMSL